MTLVKDFHEPSIDELYRRWRHGRLNLSPSFQRESVWRESDRRALITSLLHGIPIPSIFLHRRSGRGGAVHFDVIDGKQRLESILLFMEDGPLARDHEQLWVKTSLDEESEPDWWSWESLKRAQRNGFLKTSIQTVEVEGELADIVDLFVRINSTGRHLTSQERRHARYFTSPLLRAATLLATKEQRLLVGNGILNDGQVARMKHIELMTELLISVHTDMPVDKKRALDSILASNGQFSDAALRDAGRDVSRSIQTLLLILPDIKTTRFRRTADFYTLTLLLHRLRQEGQILRAETGPRLALAGALLREFGSQVDEAAERQRLFKGQSQDLALASDYLSTVREGTDSRRQRQRREQFLRQVLADVFSKKDVQRSFNATQRRLVWHAQPTKKTCGICGDSIRSWSEMHVDHIKPHARGGRTRLSNAQLTHNRCNMAAGAKRPKRTAATRRVSARRQP